MKTLEKIVPTPIRIDVADERLSLTPIKTRELPAMMRAIAPILAEIQGGDILGALAKNADSIVDAVSIGSRKPREWVDELDLDDLVAVAGAVLEVNVDFFVRAVLPGLTKAVEGLTNINGLTQSTP